MPASVLEALAKLRRELQGELEGLERELEALDKSVKAKRRMLELVRDTEEQLAVQGRGQRPVAWTTGASAQVRGSAKLQSNAMWCSYGTLCPCCDSPPSHSSGPVRLRRMSSRSLSPRGPSL
jgi:DNA repair exonuclease SbcCD ATPase subunit